MDAGRARPRRTVRLASPEERVAPRLRWQLGLAEGRRGTAVDCPPAEQTPRAGEAGRGPCTWSVLQAFDSGDSGESSADHSCFQPMPQVGSFSSVLAAWIPVALRTTENRPSFTQHRSAA